MLEADMRHKLIIECVRQYLSDYDLFEGAEDDDEVAERIHDFVDAVLVRPTNETVVTRSAMKEPK